MCAAISSRSPSSAAERVHGYFLTRLVYTVDPAKLSALSVPPKDLITDELYTLLVGNRVIDFPKMDNFDLKAFRDDIRNALNKRVGADVFHDVMVDQIDFLSKSDIRGQASHSQVNVKSGTPIADAGASGRQPAKAGRPLSRSSRRPSGRSVLPEDDAADPAAEGGQEDGEKAVEETLRSARAC